MKPTRVIGIDPGPVPGFVAIDFAEGTRPAVSVVQCSADLGPDVLRALLLARTDAIVHVQIERFVVGRGSMRTGTAGALTRDLVGRLLEVVAVHHEVAPGTYVYQRSAAVVKPWATDDRLEAAGIYDRVKGMRHAKDAARHALFCAVHEGLAPDPLSSRWSA